MKFIDEYAVADLAKASSTLQCILSILEFECTKYLIQVEVIWVNGQNVLVSLDGLTETEVQDVCLKVNKQFRRKDGKFTCWQKEHRKTYVECEALPISDYTMLT